jgi:tRNA(Ile)-lysidine synthase
VSQFLGLEDRVRNFIREHGLLQPEARPLLAVSGGLDSTALVHFIAGQGHEFGIAHCNYRMRGADSDADEAFVRKLGRTYGVPVFVFHYPSPVQRVKQEGNFQERARQYRYTHLKKILDEYNFTVLLTAHHLDDSLETLLINFGRGCGYAGLSGIPLRSDFPLARPFLAVSRREILDYAHSESLSWREDASNQSNDYLRNRLRHRVIPKLRNTLGLDADRLRTTMDQLRSGRHFYNFGLSRTHYPELQRQGNDWSYQPDDDTLSRSEQLTLLRHHLLPEYPIHPEELRYVLTLADGMQWIRDDLVVRRYRGKIHFTFRREEVAPATQITEFPMVVSSGRSTVRFSVMDRPENLATPGRWYLRLPRLPLHLRPRKNGDRMRPFGLGGSKKIKDILIDAKVPAWERDAPLVLTDAEGSILALVGHCIDEAVAVGPGDARVLAISVNESPASG